MNGCGVNGLARRTGRRLFREAMLDRLLSVDRSISLRKTARKPFHARRRSGEASAFPRTHNPWESAFTSCTAIAIPSSGFPSVYRGGDSKKPRQRKSIYWKPYCWSTRVRSVTGTQRGSMLKNANVEIIPDRIYPWIAIRRYRGASSRLLKARLLPSRKSADCITATRVLRNREHRLAWLVRRYRSASDRETA